LKKVIRTSLVALAAAMTMMHAHAAPTLVESVQGYTLQHDQIVQFSGLVFDQGKVVATGDAAALRAKYPDAKRIDGQGKTLLPGLIDAHGHVFRLGFKTTEISLSGTRDLQEAQGLIRAYGQKNLSASGCSATAGIR
jgi:predicted amidohydrolase YtcJ